MPPDGRRCPVTAIRSKPPSPTRRDCRRRSAKTPADNQTLVQSYKDKATSFRKEAQDYRTVAKEYRQGDKAFDVTGHANAWALRIASQHEKMAADADRMAVDADKLVDFLQKLGKEM